MEAGMNQPPTVNGNSLKLDYDVMRGFGLSPDEWYSYDRDDRALMTAQFILDNAIKGQAAFEKAQEIKKK